jgi:hypothetical protein
MKRICSLRVIIPFAVLLLSVSLYSCSENPVVPPVEEPYQFDSARYEWRSDTLDVLTGPLKVFSESNIYFLNIIPSRALVKYDGTNYNLLSYLDISASCLEGFDENELYIGGADLTQQNYGKPRLKKWSGSAFSDIEVPNPENRDFAIANFFLENPNELWMCSAKGDVLKYDIVNNSFESQRVDTNEIYLSFANDEFGNYYCYGFIYYVNKGYNILKIYKKEKNWNWVNVFSEQYFGEPLVPFSFHDNFLAIKFSENPAERNRIYKFINNNFSEFMDIREFRLGTLPVMGGSSYSDFVMAGLDFSTTTIYHFNGNNFSREFSTFNYSLRSINKIDTSYLLIFVHPIYNQSILFFGNFKN